MHESQGVLVGFEELDDETLVDTVLRSWQTVCEENEKHRNIVTARQFSQWESFRDYSDQKMESVIESFDGILSDEDREVFESMAQNIVNATHKSESEILSTALAETQRYAKADQTTDQKKKGWLAFLRKLMHRS